MPGASMPEQFTGRPSLPGYKHKTTGRNLLVYEKGAIWKRELDQGVIALSDLGALVCTAQSRESIKQVRIVPRKGYYIVEVVYERAPVPAAVNPVLTCGHRHWLNNLARIASDKAGFAPRIVKGRPVKSLQPVLQQDCARQEFAISQLGHPGTTAQMERLTQPTRTRQIDHYLHTASCRIIDLLVAEGIGTLVIGKNPLWKQEVNMVTR